MKFFLTATHAENQGNLGLLILRLGLGILTIHHGYQKLVHFEEMKNSFLDFLGLGNAVSLTMAISAEFFCSILVVLGLFTRVAAIPLIITMSVALFEIKGGDIYGGGEPPALYLLGYLSLFLSGPGTMRIDRIFTSPVRSRSTNCDT